MQKIWCDNCGREIIEEPTEMKPEPEPRIRLEMRVIGKGLMPIDMDLCVRCARKYMRKLKEPLEDD